MYKRIMKHLIMITFAIGTVMIVAQVDTVSAEEIPTVRISGSTRYETATQISKAGFNKSDIVFIANAMNFADALAGGPLAYQKDAPILLANGSCILQE